jgi:nucleotide-binding universal stress UspA family protein
MNDIKKILVALAFSSHSKNLFRYAASLTATLNAELIVASIINSRDVDAVSRIVAMGYQADGEHYVEAIKKERTDLLQQHADEANYPVDRIKCIIKVGHPVEMLLNIIVNEAVDLVVMGTRGKSDLEHVLVGSVANKIFRKSPATVISFRDEEDAKRLRKHLHM